MRFGDPDYPFLDTDDLVLCSQIDTFDFYMPFEVESGERVIKAQRT
jgi:hypothetical protein